MMTRTELGCEGKVLLRRTKRRRMRKHICELVSACDYFFPAVCLSSFVLRTFFIPPSFHVPSFPILSFVMHFAILVRFLPSFPPSQSLSYLSFLLLVHMPCACVCAIRSHSSLPLNASHPFDASSLSDSSLPMSPITLLSPSSYLSLFVSKWKYRYYDPYRNELFFDRNRVAFEGILYYYQSFGKLRRPTNVPIDVFLEEVRFYELGESAIDKLKADEGFSGKEEEKLLPKNQVFKSIWLLFEDPASSVWARYVAIISVLVIVASIVIFCLETLPQFKHYKVYMTPDNKTKIVEDDDPSPSDPFFVVESICIVWFCLEFFLRLIACPSKLAFFRVSICSSFCSPFL